MSLAAKSLCKNPVGLTLVNLTQNKIVQYQESSENEIFKEDLCQNEDLIHIDKTVFKLVHNNFKCHACDSDGS